MKHYHVISLFPESMDSYLNSSILKRAISLGLIKVSFYNPRDFVRIEGKESKNLSYAERRVDDKPYGGGPGMVIEALPVIYTIEKILADIGISQTLSAKEMKAGMKEKKVKIIFLSPNGKQFTNKMAETLSKYDHTIFIAGRYEGIDARVRKIFPMLDVSIGPYVVTGGELATLIMIDAMARRIPGVLGDFNSLEENRSSGPLVYTRPEVIEYGGKKYKVPKVLLSGHHKNIDSWRVGKRKKSE